ncbi:MAG: PAS domain S-box protein [Nitrospirae bacterium]|nr:MAG: PAS domain S-box protein [Nitrospirota bacterium]
MGHEKDRAELARLKARVAELERLLKAQQAEAASQAGQLSEALKQVHDRAAILRTIVASTSAATGAEFFRALVTSLASTLGVRCAFVAEVMGSRPGHMHTLALWMDGGLGENFDYALAGTPCEHIVTGRRMLVFPRGIRQQFPDDRFLADAALESYMGFPLFDEKGGVMGLVGVMHDVPTTEDSQAQSLLEVYASRVETELRRLRLIEALQENEEKYRLLFSRAMDAVMLIDVDTYRFLDANDVALGMYGYSRDEFLRLRVPDVSAEPTKSLAAIRQAAETGGLHVQLRWHRKRDGTVFPVEISCGVFTWKGRTAMCAVIRDVTERKQAEDVLRENAAKFQALLDHSPAMVFLKDTEGRYLLTNRRFEQAFHLTREAVIGKTDQQLFPPAQAAAFSANDRKVLQFGMPMEFEEVAMHDDGPHTSIVVKFPLYNEKGEVCTIGGITTDITERKRFEEVLQRSEASLAEAQRIACLGNWDWDIVTDELRWSDEIYRMFGLSPKQFGATYEAFLKCVHPDDRAFVQRSVQAALVNGVPYSIDHRIQLADGTVRVVHEQAEVTRNEGGQPVRMVGTVQDVTERRRAEEGRKQLADILQATTDFVGTADRDGRALFVNRAGRRLVGIGEDEDITSARIPDFHPEWAARLVIAEGLPTAVRDGVWSGETALRTREGLEIPVSQVILSHKTPEGEITYFSTIARDLRDRKHLEEQLRQAAKMEAVGRLAGGIAHDFNNLLTVIIGYSDLLVRRLAAGDQLRRHAEEIKKAGRHAANLTGQLLAFGRRQVTQPKVLDVNRLVTDMVEMLRRLIGENVRLVTDLQAGPCLVKADPDQLAQVLMNLAVNARDAMPEGGTLTVETARVEGEIVPRVGRAGPAPGPYVKLTVRDTGCGMDADTKTHIFEPFFTTKDRLKGTGLGLAMVYGIIAQHGGTVTVDSASGRGAVFTVYLPQTFGSAEAGGEIDQPDESGAGGETILLVEDEPVVRDIVHDLLLTWGYCVLTAAGGEEALRRAESHRGPIHLLLTDVVMPGMSGRQLAEQVRRRWPETHVLFMSGYTDDVVIRHGLEDLGGGFLQKPFESTVLQKKIRAVLDTPQD